MMCFTNKLDFMKKNTQLCLKVTALFLLLGFSACSSATEENREYGDVDINGDFVVDDNEYAAVWDEIGFYDRWDIDHDGYIDDKEWDDVPARYRGEETAGWQNWDRDADQRLSEEEFRGGVYGAFDADRDSRLNEDEFNAWYSAED